MSPEQCRGTGEVDFRTDIYALGCLLFAMVAGRPPFLGTGVGEIIGKHIYEQPPRPREIVPAISPALEGVILRALEKDPARRHPSMRAFAAALEGEAEEEVPAAAPALQAEDSESFAATADTILSTSPEAAPTMPAASAAVPVATGGRQRTVAMWIAAALAAGMAGFFVLARVDEKAGVGGGASSPVRTDHGTPAAGDTAAGPMGGGGGLPLSQVEGPRPQLPGSMVDAGTALAQETAPDAGLARPVQLKKKLVKKQTRPLPKNVDSNVAPVNPPIKQQVYDQNAPEDTPADQRAE
jgi:serine/threonine-protein kinase